jgi:hypothetical protein
MRKILDGCTSKGKKKIVLMVYQMMIDVIDQMMIHHDSSDDDSPDEYEQTEEICRYSGSFKRQMNLEKKIDFVGAYFTEFSNLIYTNRSLPALSTLGILRFSKILM